MSMRNSSEEYHKTHASELTDQLYLAACRAVTSKCLLDLGITSIVNATLELPTVAYQKQETIQIAVEDRVSAKLNIYFDLIADKIQQVHLGGGKILIYCRAGQSRSATLCIAYFMKYHDMSYDQAYQYVKGRRPIIHPNIGFVRQLKEYETKLKTKPVPESQPVAKTPSFKKDRTRPVPVRISYATDSVVDEDAATENAVDIPIRPMKQGRPIVSVHEPFNSLADNCEVLSLQRCDKNAYKYTKQPTENSVVNIQESHPVASTSVNVNTIAQVPEHEAGNGRGKRKTAFTRLAKPNDIAVSFLNIPLELVTASASNKSFKLQTKTEHCSSAISELYEAYAVSEVLHLESLQHLSKVLTSPSKAKCVLAPLRYSAAQFKAEILECAVPSSTNNKLSSAKSQMPTKLLRQPSLKGRSLNLNSRFGNASNFTKPKLNPTRVKSAEAIVDKPTKVIVKLTADCLSCTERSLPLVQWETTSPMAKVSSRANFENQEKSLKVVKGHYSMSILSILGWETTQPAPLLNIPIQSYHKLDFSLTAFETSNIATVMRQCVLADASSDFGKKMTICKEFPYYSTVLITSALDLFRAQEEAKLNIQWFKVPQASRNPDPIELIRKTSESRVKEQERKKSQLKIKWGTERFQSDEFQKALPCASVKEFPVCKVDSFTFKKLNESYSLTQNIIYYKTDLIGRFYVPQYNPILLRRDCDFVSLNVAEAKMPAIFEMTNIYSSPKSITTQCQARSNLHVDCMTIATTAVADVRSSREILENIPDEIHDIAEMKHLIAENSDSPRCKIWFEVFKRTLIRKRPTYANVTQCEFLCTPTSFDCAVLEFSLAILPNSFAHEVASRKLTMPHSIATIRDVALIEKFTEFSKFVKPKLVPEKFSSRVVSSDEYVIDISNFVYETTKNFLNSDFVVLEHAISTVSFPNRLYTVSEEEVLGTTDNYTLSKEFSRIPFSVVTRLHNVVDCLHPVQLRATTTLPEYQFVQDIEDQADTLYHKISVADVALVTETDSFWFFSLETASVQPEAGADTTSSNPSNFLLFLPDRKLATKIGQEDIFPDNDEENEESDLNVVNPEAVVAEVLLEIKDQTNPTSQEKSTKDKRVTFERGAVASKVYEKEETNDTKKRVKTIYYGRDRSKSRTRLKEVETGGKVRRDRSASRYNEAEIMHNLARSVDEANTILLRRRAGDDESSTRYSDRVTFSPSPERYSIRSPRLETRSEERFARRSREQQRNREETERMERSKRSLTKEENIPNQPAQVDPATGGGIGGLINFASNIFANKSRREKSKDRSRGLLRKSARNFL